MPLISIWLPPAVRSLAAAVGEGVAVGVEQLDRRPDPVGAIFAIALEALPAGAGRAAEADVAADDTDQDADHVGFVQRADARCRGSSGRG